MEPVSGPRCVFGIFLLLLISMLLEVVAKRERVKQIGLSIDTLVTKHL